MTENVRTVIRQNCCARCSGRKAAERQTDKDHWTFLCVKCVRVYDARQKEQQS